MIRNGLLILAVVTLAMALPVSARASVGVSVVSSSSYGPDAAGYEHIVGEVQNTGTANADFVQINFNLYSSTGTLLSTDFTYAQLDTLAPGERSGFHDVFVPPTGYDHFAIGSASASPSTGPLDHNFTTQVTNVFTDIAGYQHVVGTVTNNNSTSVTYVQVTFTFRDCTGTVVDADFTYVNTDPTSTLGPNPASASFELIRTAGAPAFRTASVATQTSDAANPYALPAPTQLATPPDPPSGVSAIAANASARVSWTTPACNGGAAISQFTVTSSPGNYAVGAGAGSNTATVPGLPAGTYTFTVVASNTAGPSAASSASNPVTLAPTADLSAASFTFPKQLLGSISPAQKITLSNHGNEPLTGIVIGTSSDFTQTNTCASTLAMGASCDISLSFRPQSAGTIVGTVTITNSAGTQTASLSGIGVQGARRAVLPAMANTAYGGYTTIAEMQNVGVSTATLSILYYDTSGNLVGQGDSLSALSVNASWTVRQDNGNGLPAGAAGSAVVYSDQPVASFVNEFAPSASADATSYTGINPVSGTGNTLYAPTIVNNAYGGYTTGIGLVNTGSVPTDITITYRDSAGTIMKTQAVNGVAAGAYQGLYSGDAGLGLPTGFAGSATITSSAGPVAAIINETGPGSQFSSYDAATGGSTTLNAPVALNNAFGGYNTGMGIQNASGTAGTVSINYYNATGTATTKTFSIAANGSLGVYQGTDITTPGAYTAQITSTVPVAAIVNEVAPSNTSAKQSTAYNTFDAGSATLHLPLVENAGTDNWSTGQGIMNTGAAATTVTVTYYDTVTGALVGTSQTQLLQPKAFWGLYQPTGGLPSGTRASALVTTSPGGLVAVICNESDPTAFMSYLGE